MQPRILKWIEQYDFLSKDGFLRMILDPKKLDAFKEDDIKKFRKPKFHTFENGTVKFQSSFVIELEDNTYDIAHDFIDYPMEFEMISNFNFTGTENPKDFPLMHGSIEYTDIYFRKCQALFN